MKQISKCIGISEQNISRHFENKLVILTSIIRYFNQSLTTTHMESLAQHPATTAVIYAEKIFQNESSLAQEVRESLNKRIDHIITKGQQID